MMKTIIYLFMAIVSWSVYAQVEEDVPRAVTLALELEKLATEAQSNLQQQASREETYARKREISKHLYEQYDNQIEPLIYAEQNPQTLYLLISILHEGYDLNETLHDRLLFSAQAKAEIALAKLGTEKAYRYFIQLKSMYGTDGAGVSTYRTLEYRYLKKYSKDPNVLNSATGIFI